MEIDNRTSDFVEGFGLLVSEAGLPRSVGRVLGLLLVCEPEQISAEQIQTRLQLSTGAVSAATSLLCKLGYMRRITFPSSRKLFYELDPDCWKKLVQSRMAQVEQGLKLADDGLKLRNNNPRLLGMRQIYLELESFMRQIKI